MTGNMAPRVLYRSRHLQVFVAYYQPTLASILKVVINWS